MKKVVCILVLTCVIAGGAFAQAKKPAAKSRLIHNWISGEAGLIEAGVRYEYMLNKNFGVGVTAFWNSLFFLWNSYGIQATGRFFPWGGVFYGELGLGYGTITGTEDVSYTDYDWYGRPYSSSGSWWYSASGLMVTPGVGWKIDPGAPGGFFINPMLGVPVIIGKRNYTGWLGSGNPNSGIKVGFNVKIACGFGYAF